MKANIKLKFIISVIVISFTGLFFMNTTLASTAKVAVDTANLRGQPNTSSKILELVSRGEEVEVLDKQDNWYKVKYKKITGYLREDLIEIQEETNTKTEENVPQENNTKDNEENTTQSNTQNEQNNENAQEVSNNAVNLIGDYIAKEAVKIKIIPLINSLDIKDVNANEKVKVTEVINSWARLELEDGTKGWSLLSKLEKREDETKETSSNTDQKENKTIEAKTMYVNYETINVREKTSKSSKSIKQLQLNTEVKVLSENDGWYTVEVDGKEGYIPTNLLSSTKTETSRSSLNNKKENNTNTQSNSTKVEQTTKTQENKAPTTTTAETTKTENKTNTVTDTKQTKGEQVVSYAKQFLGYKYVYGGTTTKGFDCSGFTQYVFKNFNISLNRTAAAQYKNGASVKKLQIGDLVMFGTSASNINHVGIYIGGNVFIHAANANRGVTTDTLASGYYKTHYIGARRVI